MSEQEKLTTSPFGRFLKMGALAGRVGFALLGEKALGLFLSEDSREMRMAKAWAKNAEKIAETLGRLKGGAMKIGQMLSVQEALLPKELAFVLKTLQRDAPVVASGMMFRQLDNEIPHWRKLVKEIDQRPMASASIGQVYRALLNDGSEVAIKIQYPGIDEAICSDLKNLRRLFELLLESMLASNLDHVFAEIEARLSEEIDYERELKRIFEFRTFYAHHPEFCIPEPIEELSSRRVLTTKMLRGLTIEEARHRSQHEKNTWGRLLFRSVTGQLLAFRKLQSDPNPANYAFLDGGRIALYDFGSIKELPEWLHQGYMRTIDACRAGRFDELTAIAASMQVRLKNGDPVPYKHVELFRSTLAPLFVERPYQFRTETDPIQKIIAYNRENMDELKQITFPGDVLFVDRAIAGMIGNLTALGAEANWGDELLAALNP
jgi:predicted unusual protein kinase regulating ubiquinone biosynthesis (AarF/ABC1/UbiB family)